MCVHFRKSSIPWLGQQSDYTNFPGFVYVYETARRWVAAGIEKTGLSGKP